MAISAARELHIKNKTYQIVDVAPEDVACGKGPGHHAAEKSCHSAISLGNTLSRTRSKIDYLLDLRY